MKVLLNYYNFICLEPCKSITSYQKIQKPSDRLLITGLITILIIESFINNQTTLELTLFEPELLMKALMIYW